MKKFLAMLLAVLTVCSFAACAAKPAENDTADVEIADALTLLNTVWASYTDDEKFPAAGGDYDEANMTDGAPGKVGLDDASSVEYLVSVPADVVSKFDDAAALFHMMNLNTFTCGAYRLKDAADVDSVAAAIKEYVMGKQWMCGFPDKLIVVSVGNYIVECFGAEDLVNTFRDMHSMMPMMPIMAPSPPKNGSGLYSRIMRKMVLITLMPSPTVSSLLTEPSGRSRY